MPGEEQPVWQPASAQCCSLSICRSGTPCEGQAAAQRGSTAGQRSAFLWNGNFLRPVAVPSPNVVHRSLTHSLTLSLTAAGTSATQHSASCRPQRLWQLQAARTLPLHSGWPVAETGSWRWV